MSLTDDWKAGKLKDGDYYVRLTNGDTTIDHLCKGEWCFDYGWCEVVIGVLAPVPDYDSFAELEKNAKKYDRIKINGNYPDKISKLKSKIKHLLDLQANQDDEVERLRDENEKLRLDNNQLRLHLKDSIYILNEYKHCFDVKHHNIAANIIDKASEVLK